MDDRTICMMAAQIMTTPNLKRASDWDIDPAKFHVELREHAEIAVWAAKEIVKALEEQNRHSTERTVLDRYGHKDQLLVATEDEMRDSELREVANL